MTTQSERMASSAKKIVPEMDQSVFFGDLNGLTEEQRLSYYNSVCESVGLNPLTKPFEYVRFQGKLVLYANKSCSEQLRFIHKISIRILSREKIGDVYVITAQATTPDGRQDESTGAVALTNAKGDALANLYMKAETKAKRRVTLSICGLAFLDETEVETIPGAQKVPGPNPSAEPAQKAEEAKESPKKMSTRLAPYTPEERKAAVKRLFATARECGWAEADLKEHIQTKYQKGSTKELTWQELNEIRSFLQANTRAV